MIEQALKNAPTALKLAILEGLTSYLAYKIISPEKPAPYDSDYIDKPKTTPKPTATPNININSKNENQFRYQGPVLFKQAKDDNNKNLNMGFSETYIIAKG